MDIIQELQKELKSEYEITKRFLEHYPEDKNGWKPHEKSMSIKRLAVHIIEIFICPDFIMNTEFLDFAKATYRQPEINSKAELQQKLEEDYKKGMETLENLTPEKLNGSWDIHQGDMVIQK